MKQIWLPIFNRPDTEIAPRLPDDATPVAGADRAPVFDGQMGLFGEVTERLGEMYLAIDAGDFAVAVEHRRALEDLQVAVLEMRKLQWLERFCGPGFWTRRAAEILADWRALDASLVGDRPLRQLVRGGVFGRLLESSTPRALAAAGVSTLPALANVLFGRGRTKDDGEAVREGRAVVRDALADGLSLRPSDFEDEAIADLLAEDMDARWLVSLGALRGLWPCPEPVDTDLAAAQASSPPADDDAAATRFWSCLRVAAGRKSDDPLLHAARKQMKRLRPDLHALAMRPGWGEAV